MTWTTPRTWVAGETVTAAQMNEQLRDNLLDLTAAWTSFTPSWSASGTQPSIGNGTLTGRYARAGHLVVAHYDLTFGSTTTFGSNVYFLGYPDGLVPRATGSERYGLGGWVTYRDASTTKTYLFTARALLAAAMDLAYDDAVVNGRLSSQWSQTNPVAPANGDSLRGTLFYEAADAA